MTIEQKFLKSRGIVNFTNHHIVGIENSPIKELDKPYHALNSGFYIIDGEITEILV